ncbi:MAG: hypothetical protein V3S55_13445 [Nitrospiraceae bacterium]
MATAPYSTMGGKRMKDKHSDKPKPPSYDQYFGVEFEVQVKRRQALNAKMAKMEAERKEIDNTIGGLLEVNDLKSVMVGDKLTVTLCQGTSTHLSKTKLLELGVLLDTIEQATKRTFYPYVQIRERTEK